MKKVLKDWRILLAAGALVIAIVAGGVWYAHEHRSHAYVFPLNSADNISSWSFKGAYDGNDTLISQAEADSTKLGGLIGKGEYSDYDLYIGIGNDANLVGDGKAAYEAYDKAVAIFPNQGLAFANLGHLFDEMGAYQTAADAYAKAVAVEPGMLEYHVERLNFLVTRLPQDTTAIQTALKDASGQFGDNASILAIEAQWFEGQGRYADAVKAWQTARTLSPKDRQAAIDRQIASDQAKAAAQ